MAAIKSSKSRPRSEGNVSVTPRISGKKRAAPEEKANTAVACNICGGTAFAAGFNGRLTNGIEPHCTTCNSVERHRMIYNLYAMIKSLLSDWDALHFAPDRSVSTGWFQSYQPSTFGTENSLNMQDTGLPAGSLDLVISNHVLEHITDDRAAFGEMLRVLKPDGVIHLCVPTPLYRWETLDWGFADPAMNEHHRDYGADFGMDLCEAFRDVHAIAVTGTDPVTRANDLIFFFSRDVAKLAAMAFHWQHKAIPVVRLQ